MPRTCANPDCGATIPPQKGSARPRKYCTDCRPSRNRPNPRVIQLPAAEPRTDVVATPLTEAYQRQLADADRLDTPEGAHVMFLADLFAAGGHTAAGAASLSKELRAAMELALRGAPRQADFLDELDARRRRKATGA